MEARCKEGRGVKDKWRDRINVTYGLGERLEGWRQTRRWKSDWGRRQISNTWIGEVH